MNAPSGEKEAMVPDSSGCVSRLGSEPSASTSSSYNASARSTSQRSPRIEVKTMRLPALLVLLLVGVVADAPCEGDPLGVGRPRGRLDTLLALGQPARLAPVRRQDVQLAMRLLLLAVAV